MSHDIFYLLAAPGDPPLPAAQNLYPAWLAYQMTPQLRLMRLQHTQSLHGGVMVVSFGDPPSSGNLSACLHSLMQECTSHRFQGIFLDADIPSSSLPELVRLLSRELSRRGVTLFLPEFLGELDPHSRVMIPSALSGGSLALRISDAVEKYGADRVVLAAECCMEDFTLPAPSGCGTSLTRNELAALTGAIRPRTHFSRPLCAHYFTYCRDNSTHLVLFDDLDTLMEKIACARRCGVYRFLLPWREISSHPERFFPVP